VRENSAWLLVEASSGPGAGGGGGAEGGGAGSFRLVRFSFLGQFGASCQGARCHARCKHSSPALTCFLGRLGQEGESLAGAADLSLPAG